MVLAWYNAPSSGLVPRTGEEIKVGETVSIKETSLVKCCVSGLHGCRDILSTLQYRSSDGRMTLVEIEGDIDEEDNKLCGRTRKTLGMLTKEESTKVWQRLAIQFAELAVGWSEQEPDQRVVDCIDAAKQFLEGKITIEELYVKRDAAYAAANAADAADAADAANAACAAADAAANAAAYAAAYAAANAANAAAYAAADAAANAAMNEIADREFKKAMGL